MTNRKRKTVIEEYKMTANSNDLPIEKPTSQSWQRAFTALSYLPWAWLLLMGCFTLSVTIVTGHFPTYGQPDPKDTGVLALLYLPLIFFLPITLFSWVFWIAFGLSKYFLNLPIKFRRQEVIPFVSGYIVFIWFTLSDFVGLMNWLGD